MFPLVFAASVIAFLCLALNGDNSRSIFVVVSLVAATVASYTMPNGLLVWPVLVAQAIYLKLNRKLIIAIALLGAGIIASYCWHYQSHSLGLGLFGMLRHPIDAAMLIAFLLGGTLNSISPWLGIAVTMAAVAGAVYMKAGALRNRPPQAAWLSALTALIAYLFLSAASVVSGRLLPQWITDNTNVPSRYFTLTQFFWAAIAVLVLYRFCRTPRPVLLAGFYVALYLCLMFFNPQRQLDSAKDWSAFFQGVDALGAAFIVDAPDETLDRKSVV